MHSRTHVCPFSHTRECVCVYASIYARTSMFIARLRPHCTALDWLAVACRCTATRFRDCQLLPFQLPQRPQLRMRDRATCKRAIRQQFHFYLFTYKYICTTKCKRVDSTRPAAAAASHNSANRASQPASQ